MNRPHRDIDRRTFVKTLAAWATACGAGVGRAATPPARALSLTVSIPTRPLGRTGHVLPVLGMGIVAMKIMGGWVYGHAAGRIVPDYEPAALARLPAAAIRWVLSDPRISVLNVGVCLPSDIDENIATLAADTTLTNADRLLLADYSGRAYVSSDLARLTGASERASAG